MSPSSAGRGFSVAAQGPGGRNKLSGKVFFIIYCTIFGARFEITTEVTFIGLSSS